MLERSMNLFELIKYRRSIRKYEDRQIPREDLEKIIEAGLYAPNAGGGQRSMIVALRDPKLTEAVGKMNVGKLDRSRLSGNFVSKEQPSIIDDPSIKSGFYGAPTVCVIFAQGTSCTVFRTLSAAQRTWSWPPRNWASVPASSPGARRPSTVITATN
jgi:Nitroreductase